MTLRFQKSDGGRSKSRRPKQRNDCTVRALALTANVEYDQAYEFCAARGRKCAQGGAAECFPKSRADDQAFGWRFVWISFPARRGEPRMNPERFPELFSHGAFICRTAGHVYAVIDGVIYDTSPPRPDRCIYGCWKAERD